MGLVKAAVHGSTAERTTRGPNDKQQESSIANLALDVANVWSADPESTTQVEETKISRKKRKASMLREKPVERRSSRRVAGIGQAYNSSSSAVNTPSAHRNSEDGHSMQRPFIPQVDTPSSILDHPFETGDSTVSHFPNTEHSFLSEPHQITDGAVSPLITEDPAGFTQDNFEDRHLWCTKAPPHSYAKHTQGRVVRRKDQAGYKSLRKSKLPRNQRRKDPNSIGGLGTPIKGSLDGFDDVDRSDSNYFDPDELSERDEEPSGSLPTPVEFPNPTKHQKTDPGGRRKIAPREKAYVAFQKERGRVELLYEEWQKKKERIDELLSIPFYSATPRYQGPSGERDILKNKENSLVPPGYNLSIEGGLFVFSPTSDAFADFERFLETVEEIAGRENGVVKVNVPTTSIDLLSSETPSSIDRSGLTSGNGSENSPSPGQGNDAPKAVNLQAQPIQPGVQLSTFKLEMLPNKHTQSNTTQVYDVTSRPWNDELAIEERRRVDEHGQLTHFSGTQSQQDVLEPSNVAYGEEIMAEQKLIEKFIDDKSRLIDTVYGMDNDATPELRRALRLGDPKLADFPGNSLMKSRSRIEGIHTPYFYVSHDEYTPFGLHVEDYGAYSMNYLHIGAPKCWYVVKPKHQKLLEEFLHGFTNPGEILLGTHGARKPQRPPQCSQFLRHQSMFLPEQTLRTVGLDFTRVIQRPGQMVITFPWAYHQGFNTGPNIAEAIGYASERWEIFMREGLYQKCHRSNCLVEPLHMDFDFAKPGSLTTGHRKQKGGRARASMASRQSTATAPSVASSTDPTNQQKTDQISLLHDDADGLKDQYDLGLLATKDLVSDGPFNRNEASNSLGLEQQDSDSGRARSGISVHLPSPPIPSSHPMQSGEIEAPRESLNHQQHNVTDNVTGEAGDNKALAAIMTGFNPRQQDNENSEANAFTTSLMTPRSASSIDGQIPEINERRRTRRGAKAAATRLLEVPTPSSIVRAN